MDVDPVAGYIYWTDNGRDRDNLPARVGRANLDGSNPQIIYQSTVLGQSEIADEVNVDTDTGHVYWLGGQNRERSIRRMNPDGTGITTIVQESIKPTESFAIDTVNDYIYFIRDYQDEDWLFRTGLSPNSPLEPILQTTAYSLFVDSEDNRLIAADFFANEIFEVDLDSYSKTTLISSISSVRDVVRYDDSLYFDTRNLINGLWYGGISRSDPDGSDVSMIYTPGPNLQFDPIAFAVIPEPTSMAVISLSLILITRRRQ